MERIRCFKCNTRQIGTDVFLKFQSNLDNDEYNDKYLCDICYKNKTEENKKSKFTSKPIQKSVIVEEQNPIIVEEQKPVKVEEQKPIQINHITNHITNIYNQTQDDKDEIKLLDKHIVNKSGSKKLNEMISLMWQYMNDQLDSDEKTKSQLIIKINDRFNQKNKMEAEMRKEERRRRERKKEEDQLKYPNFIYYVCEDCKEHKEYTQYDPLIDEITGETYYIQDKDYPDGILLDVEDKKVYNIEKQICKECQKHKENKLLKYKEEYQKLRKERKGKCECGAMVFWGYGK